MCYDCNNDYIATWKGGSECPHCGAWNKHPEGRGKKRLTKKQLYGYSYMKWDIIRIEHRKMKFGYCSFCFAAMKENSDDGTMCQYCQIDKNLCGVYSGDSLYDAIRKANRKFSHLVNEMCMKLSERYYDHD